MVDKYSIKDLENLTGTKAHTIRIWEKRYSLLSPERTDTNIRYYSEDELKKILNINLLYSNGYKVSKIAALSEDEIVSKSAEIVHESQSDTPLEVKELLQAMLDLDPSRINELLERAFQEHRMIGLYQNVVIPLLENIGELWQLSTLNISHEHLFSNEWRAFVLGKTNEISRNPTGKKALLFLPEQEEHELPLLVYQYLLRDKGWECYFLGQKVPLEDFEQSYFKINPHLVITSMIRSVSPKQFRHALNKILEIVPERRLCLSGANSVVYKSEVPRGVSCIHGLADMVRVFEA